MGNPFSATGRPRTALRERAFLSAPSENWMKHCSQAAPLCASEIFQEHSL